MSTKPRLTSPDQPDLGASKFIKHPAFWIAISAFVVIAVAVITAIVLNNKSAPYQFVGQLSYSDDDGRSFVCEDAPENAAEETIHLYYLYEVMGEFDKQNNLFHEPYADNVAASVEASNNGEFTNYIFHDISTLDKNNYPNDYEPFSIEAVTKKAKELGLTDYNIIHTVYSIEYSPARYKKGPQFSEGRSERDFLVGKTKSSDVYKLYDFGMPFGGSPIKNNIAATVIEVDTQNGGLLVSGAEVGEKCYIDCSKGLIISDDGIETDVGFFKKGDLVDVNLFGEIKQGTPNQAVAKAIYSIPTDVAPESATIDLSGEVFTRLVYSDSENIVYADAPSYANESYEVVIKSDIDALRTALSTEQWALQKNVLGHGYTSYITVLSESVNASIFKEGDEFFAVVSSRDQDGKNVYLVPTDVVDQLEKLIKTLPREADNETKPDGFISKAQASGMVKKLYDAAANVVLSGEITVNDAPCYNLYAYEKRDNGELWIIDALAVDKKSSAIYVSSSTGEWVKH